MSTVKRKKENQTGGPPNTRQRETITDCDVTQDTETNPMKCESCEYKKKKFRVYCAGICNMTRDGKFRLCNLYRTKYEDNKMPYFCHFHQSRSFKMENGSGVDIKEENDGVVYLNSSTETEYSVLEDDENGYRYLVSKGKKGLEDLPDDLSREFAKCLEFNDNSKLKCTSKRISSVIGAPEFVKQYFVENQTELIKLLDTVDKSNTKSLDTFFSYLPVLQDKKTFLRDVLERLAPNDIVRVYTTYPELEQKFWDDYFQENKEILEAIIFHCIFLNSDSLKSFLPFLESEKLPRVIDYVINKGKNESIMQAFKFIENAKQGYGSSLMVDLFQSSDIMETFSKEVISFILNFVETLGTQYEINKRSSLATKNILKQKGFDVSWLQ